LAPVINFKLLLQSNTQPEAILALVSWGLTRLWQTWNPISGSDLVHISTCVQ